MALESILFRRYTHQSDVWSYGKRLCVCASVCSVVIHRPLESCCEFWQGEHLNVTYLCPDRGDSVGDDVIRGGAVRIRAASGSAKSAGEGRTTVTASHLYHRCLHGYG